MACLGGGADAAPACADDPAWTRDRRDSCASYGAGQRNHAYCADDEGDDGRTAAAACALACGTCPEDDGPAARLDQACDHACSLQQLLLGGGGAASPRAVPPVSRSTFPLAILHTEHTMENNDVFCMENCHGESQECRAGMRVRSRPGLRHTTDVPPLKFDQYKETSEQLLVLLRTRHAANDALDAGTVRTLSGRLSALAGVHSESDL